MQVLVVLDGVTRPVGNRWDFPGLQVEWLELPGPVGFCRAINHGLKQARFPWIEFLNDDARVERDWYKAPLALLQRERVGAVAPLILRDRTEPPLIDSAGDSVNPLGILRNRYRLQPLSRAETETTEVMACGGCAGFFRREALEAMGGLPESFGAYFEDVAISLSLRAHGWRIFFEPQSRVIHAGGQSYGPPRGPLLAQQARNEEWIFWHYFPTLLIVVMALPRLGLLLTKALVHTFRGSLSWWLWGKFQGLTQNPRKPPESKRKVGKRQKGSHWVFWPWFR